MLWPVSIGAGWALASTCLDQLAWQLCGAGLVEERALTLQLWQNPCWCVAAQKLLWDVLLEVEAELGLGLWAVAAVCMS